MIKNVKLSDEQIQDLINLINDRVTLGTRGNLVGECKTILGIVNALEIALIVQESEKEEPPKEEPKKDVEKEETKK